MLRLSLLAFLVSSLCSFVIGRGILYILNHYSMNIFTPLIAFIVIEIAIAITQSQMLYCRHCPPSAMESFIEALPVLIGILCALWALPAFIIYWMVAPGNFKKAIQIFVFLASASVGLLYYLTNRDKLPTLADKVTFFSGVCLGPITVVEIFM